MNSPAPAPGQPQDSSQTHAKARDDALRELDCLALRTAALARIRARERVAEGAEHHPAPATGSVPDSAHSGSGPFAHDDTGTDQPREAVALPGLPPWIPDVLGVLRGSSTVLRPDYAPDGTVRDFIVVAANHIQLNNQERGTSGQERTTEDFLGRPLSETRPGARTSGMYDAYHAALAKGGPVSTGTIDYVDVLDGTLQHARLRGTVTLLGTEGLLLTNWEPVGEARISRRIQESSRTGWVEWDLVAGRVQWSQGLRELLGLTVPPSEGVEPGDARSVDRAARTVAPAREIASDIMTIGRMLETDDVPGFADDVRVLLEGGEVSDREITIHGRDRDRRVRWIGSAQPPGAKPPESVLLAARDITEQDERLRAALSDAERLRQEAAAERRVSETFRHALTPPLAALKPSWLSVSAAYVASESGVGGDWYKCRELPDGRVLLAVGDASGHGVEAASRAVQQRSALAGLAYTDGDAGELATALGEVVYYAGIDTTATAVLGHLDPETRVLRWASAGHPSPVLVRDGEPTVLKAEHGVMFGVTPEATYPVNSTQLRSGDMLLIYTDGVIERRGMDIDAGVAALLSAVRYCATRGDDAETVTDCLVETLLGPEAEDDATILALHVA
ncbi:serine/threonine-protein phosphatase [Streptomyces sp. NBC_01186]|uniref:PP2C family protein-serine/threonine phosphatase n=1 Tax=unclassified Streptomyces TaxID=2593676 RepID=UPI002DD92135|nr:MULTISPECIES: PP2C family protein-serine/threonine phosphatase [unclassified Streptomyces]WSB80233.1 serine/threonine-protein phosphatase [Streptomyces sp. NBC_01775]WSS11559.1 serine/threonine-protein phosphatase [Streptomyces sp. NBC_01186]